MDFDCNAHGEFTPSFGVVFGLELCTAIRSTCREGDGKTHEFALLDESIHDFDHTLARNTVSLVQGLTNALPLAVAKVRIGK